MSDAFRRQVVCANKQPAENGKGAAVAEIEKDEEGVDETKAVMEQILAGGGLALPNLPGRLSCEDIVQRGSRRWW